MQYDQIMWRDIKMDSPGTSSAETRRWAVSPSLAASNRLPTVMKYTATKDNRHLKEHLKLQAGWVPKAQSWNNNPTLPCASGLRKNDMTG